MDIYLNNNTIKNSVSKISAVICIICASSSIAVLVLLIINSKTAGEITSFSLYSSFLTIFYIINSIYHFFPFHNKAKKVFYILSHAFFIMMIWGVYIPPCLILLKNGLGWSFFGIITYRFLLLNIAMVFYRLSMYESNKRYTLFLPLFYSVLIISNICHAVFMFRYVANIF